MRPSSVNLPPEMAGFEGSSVHGGAGLGWTAPLHIIGKRHETLGSDFRDRLETASHKHWRNISATVKTDILLIVCLVM
jgi:hypothetical protein